MAETTPKRRGEIVRKAFEIIEPHQQGMPSRTVIERMRNEMVLSDFERSTYPSRPKVRRFDKIVRFATISPVKAGWLIKERGVWRLTHVGRAALDRFKDPVEFDREVNRLYSEWRRTRTA